jgi:hypothetical protein
MLNWSELATTAVAKALRMRRRLGIAMQHPICAFDAAEQLGIEVRSVDFPSMEGMYIGGNDPKILISALRPQGRRNFTCAHEIGHHVFEHGEQFDELLGDRTALRKHEPNEFSADTFAAYFLMPKSTLEHGMHVRGYSYAKLHPLDVYTLASWLGVGYQTLISHMRYGLNVILHGQAQELLKFKPRDIRQQVFARAVGTNLHVVDRYWTGRAIDVEIGDYILAPTGSLSEGAVLGPPTGASLGIAFEARHAGIGRICNAHLSWSAFVRVSRRSFVGRSCFRFEEEVDE